MKQELTSKADEDQEIQEKKSLINKKVVARAKIYETNKQEGEEEKQYSFWGQALDNIKQNKRQDQLEVFKEKLLNEQRVALQLLD